jgi:hypothetical protein
MRSREDVVRQVAGARQRCGAGHFSESIHHPAIVAAEKKLLTLLLTLNFDRLSSSTDTFQANAHRLTVGSHRLPIAELGAHRSHFWGGVHIGVRVFGDRPHR